MLLGGPGAGKGTQAERLSEALGFPRCPREICFAITKNETELGLLAKGYMERGTGARQSHGGDGPRTAVADGRGERCHPGWFPRTIAQAEALHSAGGSGFKLAVVPYIKVPEDVLLARWPDVGPAAMRRDVSPALQSTAEDGVCDKCGGELYQDPTTHLKRRSIALRSILSRRLL